MPESDRVQYNLSGLMNLTLNENSVFKVENNQYIEAIQLDNNLTKMTLYLKSGVHYDDNASEIDLFAKEIIFNLITKTETEIMCPDWYMEGVFENGKLKINERIKVREDVAVLRSYSAESIYNAVVTSPTAIRKHTVIYERIFGILQNENPVVQFMSLYQILLEQTNILAGIKDVDKYDQIRVANYLKTHKSKYPFNTFQKSRKASRPWKEDKFTYIRNEIGHCEETNDVAAYKQAGSQITSDLIKNILLVLNDVIMEL